MAILVKEMSNFGNSCKETNIFFKFWSLECNNLASFAWKMPTHGTFDVETSLAKGIIFRKIGLANGAILKLWAAHPCPKFSREPPRAYLQMQDGNARRTDVGRRKGTQRHPQERIRFVGDAA